MPTMKLPPLEPHYDLTTVARLTGLAVPTLRKLMVRNQLRVVRVAGTRALRVAESEVRRLLAGAST